MTIQNRGLNHFAAVAVLFALLTGCGNPGPEPINYGQDSCDYCRMTIMEPGFGSELITKTGKVYKFDAIECLAAFEIKGTVPIGDRHSYWVGNYDKPGELIPVDSAFFVQSESLHSPMGVGLCAVENQDTAVRVRDVHGGVMADWQDVLDIVRQRWDLHK